MIVKKFKEKPNPFKYKTYFKNYKYLDNTNKSILYTDIDMLKKFNIKFIIYYYIMKGEDIYLSINAYSESDDNDDFLKRMNFRTDNSTSLFSIEEIKEVEKSIINSNFWHTIKKEDVDQLIDTVTKSRKFNI